jgi:D-serine deaminase-like pyridoxal phosphate-dependent protein
MTLFSKITKPTLLLDETKAKENLEYVFEKIKRQNITFRPHFKTDQSAAIGEWFRELGINQITVSSVEMAEYFANSGWNDILMAFPINLREINGIEKLAQSITLSVLIEARDVAAQLDSLIDTKIGVWIKVDVGSGRTGIVWSDLEKIEIIAKFVKFSRNLQLLGVLTHSGHTYRATGQSEIQRIYNESLERLQTIKKHLEAKLLGPIKISVGDTPSTIAVSDFGDIDEIRPGNFIFYDVQQSIAGVCGIENIAVAVACPVVSTHPERLEATIYGGAIHFSKDFFQYQGSTIAYGYVVAVTENGWDDQKVIGYVKSLSQEHGILRIYETEMENVKPGDIICVLPAHSCLTVQILRNYLNLDGEIIRTINSNL